MRLCGLVARDRCAGGQRRTHLNMSVGMKRCRPIADIINIQGSLGAAGGGAFVAANTQTEC